MCYGYNYFSDSMSDSPVTNCSLLLPDLSSLTTETHQNGVELKFGSSVQTFEQYAQHDIIDINNRYKLYADKSYSKGQQAQIRQTMLMQLPASEVYLYAIYSEIETAKASVTTIKPKYWDYWFFE